MFLAVNLATNIVAPLKAFIAMRYLQSLTQFGGEEVYSSLLGPRPPTGRSRHCWLGEHASSGFVLLALSFTLRDHEPRLARYALAFAFTMGCLLSLSCILQSTHFLSHNLRAVLSD